MLKNPELLKNTLVDFTRRELLRRKFNGVVIILDGTLGSLVNICIAQALGDAFQYEVVLPVFNQNKPYVTHLLSLASRLNVEPIIKDLSKDLDTLALYKNSETFEDGVAYRKRLSDLAANTEADKKSLMILGNLCYSQWCVDFPHRNYQNNEQIHLLNRLFYKELQEFATYLKLPDLIVERRPFQYISRSKPDEELLGFTYRDLEAYLRGTKEKDLMDLLIQDKLKADNRQYYLGPVIQRPSNILG